MNTISIAPAGWQQQVDNAYLLHAYGQQAADTAATAYTFAAALDAVTIRGHACGVLAVLEADTDPVPTPSEVADDMMWKFGCDRIDAQDLAARFLYAFANGRRTTRSPRCTVCDQTVMSDGLHHLHGWQLATLRSRVGASWDPCHAAEVSA